MMDNTLPNSDFSYDPVTAISEDEAKGKTAEIFLDIRKTMNISLITSIWRGLASMDNSLEEVWALTKPIYLSGTPELALKNMINTINIPTPAFNNNFKDIKKSDLLHIKNIITVYNKSNGMNLMALSALVMSEYKPRIAIINTPLKIMESTFPELMKKDDITSESWLIVKKVNSLGSPQGEDAHIATLWRHLAHWPHFLSIIYNHFKILDLNGDINTVQKNVLEHVKTKGINLKRQKIKYEEIDSFTLNTITDYVHTTNQVIRMVVLGHMMIKWIEQ